LLFTNDVRFGDAMTDPAHHVPKRYRVTLDQPPLPDHKLLWERGMTLDDGTQLLPAKVRHERPETPEIELTVVEGKNRQIRRMVEQTGYRVITLVRCGIGSLELGNLKEGEVRPLTVHERTMLLRGVPHHRGKGEGA